jgi:GT2 family glycosyltransferase
MIPKIIHQIWIGPLEMPINLMNTWKDKHPDFEYILWTETEIINRNLKSLCQKQIHQIKEINGKADILRWEILYQYGGYFVDADSFCIEPFDSTFENNTGFAGYENEQNRKGIVATGTMGFVKNHPLCRDIIKTISNDSLRELINCSPAWYSVGPGLITRILNTGNYKDITIYPSYYFIPIHYTHNSYTGHKRVYADQHWGTGNNCYSIINTFSVSKVLLKPEEWYSVVITSYNTNPIYINECLESIRCQNGYFGIELVWVNDGSDIDNTKLLIERLSIFENKSRFIKCVYIQNSENKGTAKSSNIGINACSNEIIFKMDSDDLMLPNRMITQINFMKENNNAVICGANMSLFKDKNGIKEVFNKTNHINKISRSELYKTKSKWLMNHPTFCFRKSKILEIGGYNENNIDFIDDYDLLVRVLRYYEFIYNISDVLLLYRVHSKQMSNNNYKSDVEIAELQNYIIESNHIT